MTGNNKKINLVPVSEEVRRAHSKALQRRRQWRDRYAVLTVSIRRNKQRLRAAHKANSTDRAAEIELSALRDYADTMMFYRDLIKIALRETAYEYVDKIDQAA